MRREGKPKISRVSDKSTCDEEEKRREEVREEDREGEGEKGKGGERRGERELRHPTRRTENVSGIPLC